MKDRLKDIKDDWICIDSLSVIFRIRTTETRNLLTRNVIRSGLLVSMQGFLDMRVFYLPKVPRELLFKTRRKFN